MTRVTARSVFFRLAFAGVLLLGVSGCSNAYDDTAVLNGADAGARGADGGVNAPSAGDDVGIPPFDKQLDSDKEPVPAAGESPDGFSNRNSCFDDADNDGNGSKDCSDTNCMVRPACCVGNSNCCTAMPESSVSLNFAACSGENITACNENLSLFGEASVDGNGVTFGVDLSKSSGVVLAQALDLRTLQREVTFDIDSGCDESFCAGTSGVSLVRTPEADGRADVIVGLQAFATTNTIGLVIENTVVSSWNLGDTKRQTWSYQVSPSGEVKVRGPSTNYVAYVAAEETAYAMVHGQGSGAPAITSLTVETLVCDSPRAWLPSTALTADDGLEVINPSIAENEAGEIWVAFERDRRIHFGQLVDDVIEVATTRETAVFPDGFYFSAVRVTDPELVWEREGWTLYFTGYAEDALVTRSEARGEAAVGAIIRARINPTTFSDENGYAPVLAPYGTVAGDTFGNEWLDVLDYEMPTVTVTQNPSYPWIMVVRAHLTNGTTELRAFKSTSGIVWDRVYSEVLETRTRRDGVSTSFRFDAEAVTQPSLLVQNRAYHLYYEGQRGGRSSIGLLVSDDLLGWRDISAQTAVFEEGTSDFDRIGAGAADVLFDGESVRMLYVGDDGSDYRPALVRRIAPRLATVY